MDLEGLTVREREVIEHLAAGWSNAAIAARLGCTCRTVESHVDHIFDKLAVPRDAAVNRRVFATRCYLAQVAPSLRTSTDVARTPPS